MNEIQWITSIGLASQLFRVIMKLIFTRYHVPGLSEFFAF